MPARWHLVPVAGTALLSPLLLAAVPSNGGGMVDGLSLTFHQTSTQRGVQPNTMQVRVLGSLGRIDYQKPQPGMTAGTYLLLQADSARVTMVSPREKTATVMPIGGILSVLGAALGSSGLMKAEFSDISVESSEVGPGEAILGHPTQRFNVLQSYVARISVMGMRREMKTRATMEVWVATDIPAAEARALEEFGRNLLSAFGGMGGFGGDGMRELQEELARKLPAGVQLRQITTTISEQGNRRDSTVTTSEVTEFTRGPLDPALFEVPAGYRVERPGGGESGSAPAPPGDAVRK